MNELKVKKRTLEKYINRLTKPKKDWPYDIQRGLRCINKHLFHPGYSVHMMKEICKIADRNYSSRFRNYVGMTPRAYIACHRVRAGKKLLEHKELSNVHVNDIGFSVGYEKPSSFTMIFKRKTGVSPKVWKEKEQ
jgi:AraC-like DNA-binding protein